MENRKFIREEGINSRTDGSGTIFAHNLHGVNTRIMFVGRHQGPDRYNGSTFNRMTVTVDLQDVGLSMTSKYKDTHGGMEGLLVQYGLDVMEDDTYEEYYKTVLLLTKNSLEHSIESGLKLLQKFDKGEYAYPITSKNVDTYRNMNALYKKSFDTLDITTKDLKYFAQYEREGLVTDREKQFAY